MQQPGPSLGTKCITAHAIPLRVSATLPSRLTPPLQAFDDLLLMKVGGQIIYHGPLGQQSIELVKYFEVDCCWASTPTNIACAWKAPLV